MCTLPAHADTIYECTDKGGSRVLQNMPCDGGAAAPVQVADPGDPKAAPAAASTQNPPEEGSGAEAADAAQPRPGAGAAASASAEAPGPAGGGDQSSQASEPELGMTQQQVKAILGEPTSITQEEVVEGKTVMWTYGDSRTLQFDINGRLVTK